MYIIPFMSETKSGTHTKQETKSLHILIFMFLDRKWKDKISWNE
jgi:hypothetical protein